MEQDLTNSLPPTALPTRPADRVWDLVNLVDHTTMTFDPGDKVNGSLYLCTPAQSSMSPGPMIAKFREAGLWSDSDPKQVRDGQKDAYKAQLKLVEAREYLIDGQPIVLLRCDHQKFPSNPARWNEWNRFLQRIADVKDV